jgi:glycosyltransferase involved in cell wall biosynthesis
VDPALLERIFRPVEKRLPVTPHFSVVIPAFNAESTVAETVRAVVAQPLARDLFECIVVDDGSSDRTAEVAEHAGAVVVRLPGNRGPAAARNAGIQSARGQWIAFTDADCVPSRRWLPALLAAAETADPGTLALAGKTIGLESKTRRRAVHGPGRRIGCGSLSPPRNDALGAFLQSRLSPRGLAGSRRVRRRLQMV